MTTPTLISDWKSTTDPLHKESETWLVENIYGKLESPLSQERHAYYLDSLQPVYAALEARMDEVKDNSELKDFYDVRRHRATQMQLDLLEVENAPTGLPLENLCKRISRMQPLQLIAWSFTWHQAPSKHDTHSGWHHRIRTGTRVVYLGVPSFRTCRQKRTTQEPVDSLHYSLLDLLYHIWFISQL